MHTFIDNIDMNVKLRNMRTDAQTKSLHYIQMYSVKDKIDLGIKAVWCAPHWWEKLVLSPPKHWGLWKTQWKFCSSRCTCNGGVHPTKDFSSLVQWHIPHQCSYEMSLKSEVVYSRLPQYLHIVLGEMKRCRVTNQLADTSHYQMVSQHLAILSGWGGRVSVDLH